MAFDPDVLEYVFKLKKARVRGRNVMSSCPFAETQHEDGRDKHQSFGINLDTGYWHCFSCGAKGRTLRSLAHEMRVMLPDDLMKESFLTAPPNKDALNKYNLRTQVRLTDDFLRSEEAFEELGKRGISLAVLKEHKVGYDDKGSILFPCVGVSRRVHGWVARNKSWDGRYGFGPPGIKRCFLLFGLEKPAKKILLVESMTDCLKLMTWGEPAVSTCGNMVFPEQVVMLIEAGVEEVILVPQNDLPARKWILDAKENLRGKVRVSGIPISKEFKDVGSDGYTKKMWQEDKKKIRFLY